MAKFHGVVGFVQTEETAPGVFTEVVTEVSYTGDILRNNQRWEAADKLNDNLVIGNRFSIVANPYAYTNMKYIRYIEWMGTKWVVSSIDIQRPRLVLTVGGVYNG